FTNFEYGYKYDSADCSLANRNGFAYFENCYFKGNTIGWSVSTDNAMFVNCFTERNDKQGFIVLKDCSGLKYLGGKIQYNNELHETVGQGIIQGGTSSLSFDGAYFEGIDGNINNEGKPLIVVEQVVGGTVVNGLSLRDTNINGTMSNSLIEHNAHINGLILDGSYIKNFKLEENMYFILGSGRIRGLTVNGIQLFNILDNTGSNLIVDQNWYSSGIKWFDNLDSNNSTYN